MSDKKSTGTKKKITSPEQLNDYVKVADPGVWLFLTAVIVLLIGLFIWGFAGRLDTSYLCPAAAEGGSLRCYVDESRGAALTGLQVVTVSGQEYPVVDVSRQPVQADTLSPYLRHVSGLSEDDWVYVVTVQAELDDGVYEAVIRSDSVKPISFLVG